MTESYDASAIEVLTGLEPVRKRPGMYTDTRTPHHLAQEVIDNSVDEALSGFAKQITVTLYADQSLAVADDGRGMPIDVHPEEGICGVELIMTRLHAGGKFSNRNYQFAGGLHGVGVSVVNALSRRVEVEVKRQGRIYRMSFRNGQVNEPLTIIGQVAARETGTTVRFWPGPQYFESVDFSVAFLKHLLHTKAVLCSGLRVVFHDENTREHCEWHYADGLVDYFKSAMTDADYLPQPPFRIHFRGEREALDGVIAWSPETARLTESYVNLIPTLQGGTHVNGLRAGVTEALREFCDVRDLLPRNLRLAPEDIWSGCHYLLSVRLAEPQFAGQTKERLLNRECAAFVSNNVKDMFSLFLHQQPAMGEQIAQWIIANAQQRVRAAQKVVRKRPANGLTLPGKLTDCTSQDVTRTELFLVEGDSAGGSAKQARLREFQAVLPLRGKILNTWEVDSDAVLASQEVHDIAVAIGVEPGADQLSGLRYGKLCILADADSDGAHIATLLCALFLRHFRPLVQAGHVFVAVPPLFRIDAGKEVFYALNEAEKDQHLKRLQQIKKYQGAITVTRFKGLGEMNPLQLRETTMDPATRRLVQLVMDEDDDTLALVDLLLAKKRAADRRRWLEENGHLVVI